MEGLKMSTTTRSRVILTLLLLLISLLFLTGCGHTFNSEHIDGSLANEPQSVTFSNPNISLLLGESKALDFSVFPENVPVSDIWFQSSNPNVVSVEDNIIYGKSVGESIISAVYGFDFIGKCVVKVEHIEPERIWLEADVIEGKVGRTISLDISTYPENATDTNYTVSVEDSNIAAFINGELRGLNPGKTNITITHNATGLSIDCCLSVTAIEVNSLRIICDDSLLAGYSMPLKVAIFPEDAPEQSITLKSSNKEVATIEDSVLYAHKDGVVVITATSVSGVSAEKTITVFPVLPQSLTLQCDDKDCMLTKGEKATITASVKPDNATNKKIKWSSSDETIATVSSQGVVKALKPGVVTITAKTSNGISKSIEFTINPKPVSVSNGFIKKPNGSRVAPVTINAPRSHSCYVYFKHNSNSEKNFSLFVKAGDSVTVKAPLGSYTVYYATGTTWYGTKYKFGVGTSYYKCDKSFRFYSDDYYYYGTELTLYTVPGGNLSTKEISEKDFPE